MTAVDEDNTVTNDSILEPVFSEHIARKARRRALLALLWLVPAPSIGVIAAMWIPTLRDTMTGQGVYFIAKLWLLALPVIWLRFVDRQPLSLSPARHGGFGVGIALGLVISAVILGAYFIFGPALIDPEMVRAAAEGNGIGTPLRYLGLSVYLITLNSLLEEYVWRWFVFRKCEQLMPAAVAVLASAGFFTVHHVLALKAQFGWGVTLLGSTGVFIGGAVWSWMYLRYRSVWPGYVSHAIVDVAVLIVGWLVIFGSGS